MAKRDAVSEEEAIRQAKEAIGEDKIAELQALPLAGREAILRALRSLVVAPHAPPQNRGGRPPGSGKMDLTPAFRRMAELQYSDPSLTDRAAASCVSEEMRPRLNVSPETLRKEYRKVKARFLAEVREQKRPRPRHVASVVAGSPGVKSAVPAFLGIGGLAAAVEEAMRAVVGPDMEQLNSVLLPPTIAGLASMASPVNIPELKLPEIKLPVPLTEVAERLSRGPESAWTAAHESIRRMMASSVEEAIRGLDILLLGKKPLG